MVKKFQSQDFGYEVEIGKFAHKQMVLCGLSKVVQLFWQLLFLLHPRNFLVFYH